MMLWTIVAQGKEAKGVMLLRRIFEETGETVVRAGEDTSSKNN